MKHDQGKPPYETLPWRELDEIAQVFAYGARKYDINNWQKLDGAERLIAAAIRHLSLYLQGEVIDTESRMNHLAHAATSCMMALWHSNNDGAYRRAELDRKVKEFMENTVTTTSDMYDTSDEVLRPGFPPFCDCDFCTRGI